MAETASSSRWPARFLLRLVALLAITAVIGVVYQTVENFIPYWDYARIDKLFHHLAEAFDDGVVSGFGWLLDQVNRVEYNSVFALPLMVASDFIGVSRDRIVLAVLVVHVALYLLAFGFLVRRVFGYESLDEVGFLQLGSALLLPSVFTATMLGFETVAVLPVLTVALTVFLAASWPDRELGAGARLGLFFLAGALLASTFLIRRAYAYTVISFFSTAGLVLVGEAILGRLRWWSREMIVRAAGFAAAGLGTLAVLLGVARDRVFAVLATPYHDLYAAWKITPYVAGRQLLASVGGIVLVAAAAGFVFRRFVVPEKRRVMAILLGSTALFGFLHWIFHVRLRMRLDKPMLYAPMLALGMALLFTGRDSRRWSNVMRGLCLVLLLANLGISLGGIPEIKTARRAVFADPLPPLTRADMDEYLDLATWLRNETVDEKGRGQPIVVLAASGDINDSLVKEAEIQFFGWGNDRIQVPPYNSVDRTSNYPMWLHRAEWVLVAHPFQFHTSLRERRLLRFGWDEFAENRGIARHFERIDREWALGRRANRPVRVEVWRRVREDSRAEVLDLVERSMDFVIHHPVFPNLWLEEHAPAGFRAIRVKRAGEHYRMRFHLAAGGRARSAAVLLQPLAPGTEIRIEPSVRMGRPRGVELAAVFLDERGVRDGADVVVRRDVIPLDGGTPVKVELRSPGGRSTLLRLELVRTTGERATGAALRVAAAVEIGDHSR